MTSKVYSLLVVILAAGFCYSIWPGTSEEVLNPYNTFEPLLHGNILDVRFTGATLTGTKYGNAPEIPWTRVYHDVRPDQIAVQNDIPAGDINPRPWAQVYLRYRWYGEPKVTRIVIHKPVSAGAVAQR